LQVLSWRQQLTSNYWCIRRTHQVCTGAKLSMVQANVVQNFDPRKSGYYKDEFGTILPVTTKVLAAPQAIVELVRCQCETNCSTQRCSCNKQKITLHRSLLVQYKMWKWCRLWSSICNGRMRAACKT
jgi:hypothetical protein